MSDEDRPPMVRFSNVGPGWHPIITALEADLSKLDPDYEVQQIKEKFGGLRYYASCKDSLSDEFFARINLAEADSEETCEECGTVKNVTLGPVAPQRHWIRTLCEECRETVANNLTDL